MGATSIGVAGWFKALHPGEILALCGLLTFWSRIVGGFHWAYFSLLRTDGGSVEPGGIVGFLNEFDTSASRLRVLGQMAAGLSTMLLLVALGSLWAWEAKKTLVRLAFWRVIAFSAAVGVLIHLARLTVGNGDGRPPIGFSSWMERIAEVVLYLGISAIAVKRHRLTTPAHELLPLTAPMVSQPDSVLCSEDEE